MSPAEIKKPAEGAGKELGNSCYNNNIAHLYDKVNTRCREWHIDRETFERAACVYGLMFRNYAPRSVQTLFTGKPSLYSPKAKRLAVAFFLAYIEAAERLQGLNTDDIVDAAACWRVALKLTGGAA